MIFLVANYLTMCVMGNMHIYFKIGIFHFHADVIAKTSRNT